jgi:hypothetical protein
MLKTFPSRDLVAGVCKSGIANDAISAQPVTSGSIWDHFRGVIADLVNEGSKD